MAAEADAAGEAGEGLGGDDLGAGLGQHAFIGLWQSLKQQMRKGELQHGVAEKFEALVVGLRALRFIAEAAVCERELKQRWIAKSVAKDGFQRVHEWQRLKPWKRLRSSEKVG